MTKRWMLLCLAGLILIAAPGCNDDEDATQVENPKKETAEALRKQAELLSERIENVRAEGNEQAVQVLIQRREKTLDFARRLEAGEDVSQEELDALLAKPSPATP